MELKQLYEAYKAKIAEAKGLATPEMSKETAQKVDELLREADEIKGKIEVAEKLVKADAFLAEPLEPKAAPKGPQAGANVQVVTDAGDQPWESPGKFFQAVKEAALHPRQEDERLLSVKATGMSEGVPADGGYLLTPEMRAGIWQRMYNTGQLLSRIAMDPVTGNSILINAVNESSRADGSRFGGLRGYWGAEGGTKTASKPTFRQMELKLKKVYALCYATDEQLEDTAYLASWLGRTVPEELRFQVEYAIINGTGAGQPLGIMNANCLISVTRVDASEIDSTDIANMWARRWAGANDYAWLVDPSVFPQLVNMVVGNFPLLTQIGGFRDAPYATIFGAPVIETEYNAALGTTGDIMLASLSQYQAITKGGIQADTSIHVQFVTDETAFRFVYRFDGQPLWQSALTPRNAGNTQGPFVVLTSASV